MLLLLVAVEGHAAMGAVGYIVFLRDVPLQFAGIFEYLVAVPAGVLVGGLTGGVGVGDVIDEVVGDGKGGWTLHAFKGFSVDEVFHLGFVRHDQMALIHGQRVQGERNLAKFAEDVDKLLLALLRRELGLVRRLVLILLFLLLLLLGNGPSRFLARRRIAGRRTLIVGKRGTACGRVAAAALAVLPGFSRRRGSGRDLTAGSPLPVFALLDSQNDAAGF